MPFYSSDLKPLIMRCVEALDRSKSISFDSLRMRIADGEFRELINLTGSWPLLPMPDADWQEITERLMEVLVTNTGDEGEHFYVSRNGYCLLIAVLMEVDRMYAEGRERPSPPT